MNISILDNSVKIKIDINTKDAVNAIATNASTLTYNAVQFVLNRMVDDALIVASEVSKVSELISGKVRRDCNAVINSGRASGAFIENTINSSYSVTKTQAITTANNAVTTWDAVIIATKIKLEGLVKKEVITPAKTKVLEAIAPIQAKANQIEEAIAEYTKIDEVGIIAQEVPLTQEKFLVSSDGIAPTIDSETNRKTAKSLSAMIREEVKSKS